MSQDSRVEKCWPLRTPPIPTVLSLSAFCMWRPFQFSLVPLSPGEVGTAVPILQVGKLRHRDVKSPTQGFTASERKAGSQDYGHTAVRPKINVEYLRLLSSLLFRDGGLSLNLEITSSTILVSELQASYCLHPALRLQGASLHLASYMLLGIQTRALVLGPQPFYRLSHLPGTLGLVLAAGFPKSQR